MSDEVGSVAVNYGLDDRPPLGKAILLAVQHVLTMFGATVAVPLLLGPEMGMSVEQISILISSVMLCSGLATLLQVTVGTRLPIIQGVSFSFLAAFTGIIAAVKAEGGTPREMMQYIAGAILVGAAIEATIGFSGLMGQVRRVLSPVVIGPVIMLIGLALYNVGAPLAGTCWPISILTIVLIILFSFVLSARSHIFRTFPILLAIVVSVGVCAMLTQTGTFPGADPKIEDSTPHPAHVSFAQFETAPWIRVRPDEVITPWGVPKIRLGFVLAVLAGYLASMVESYGDYHACSQMAGAGEPTSAQVSRGIGCEGIGCGLTGILGGFSSTSYSENIGLVGLTKVGSRFVVQIAAAILILLGIFGKFGALAAAIPTPVVGGLYCALFGLISAVGVRELAKADLNVDRNLFIAGFSLFMGLSVPAYFNSEPGQAAIAAIAERFEALSQIVKAVGTTGMAVAAILGLTLDNAIPGTRRQRGLE